MSTHKARVLLTNDDGVRAPGLRALVAAARRHFAEVHVVAPDREQSGASHAMTLRNPIRVQKVDERWYAVEGTPTDCVNLGVFHLLGAAPDLVLSGVNAGYNLGDDVTYSGTVAGAMEGRILGAPALAVSTTHRAGPEEFELAAEAACRIGTTLLEKGLDERVFLNVNVPPAAKGHRVTSQGRRVFREGLITGRDPVGREYYWVGLAPEEWHPEPDADHAAVEAGYVSVSPLHADLTYRRALPLLREWDLPEESL